MKYHEFKCMNTAILFAAEGEAGALAEGFQAAEALMRSYEQTFTRFSPDSELSALNRSGGSWFDASPEMFDLVYLAYQLYHTTDGLFNPGILTALELAGYDRSMSEIRKGGGRLPMKNAPADDGLVRWPWQSERFEGVRFDLVNQAIFLPTGLRIDLGGIGKGWIAEQTALLLAKYAHACLVDAGGDLFACGLPEGVGGSGSAVAGADGWQVAIEDPFDASRDLMVLKMQPGAVATSSVMRRRWNQSGQERHHLIDPRTGQPADSPWVSVTVVSAHAAQAEVLAKSILIGGPHAATNLIESIPGSVFIAVDRNGKSWGLKNSREVLYGYHEQVHG